MSRRVAKAAALRYASRLLMLATLAQLSVPALARTCLSTRQNMPPSCSPKCRSDRADRHCQACVCVLCSFCSSRTGTSSGRSSTDGSASSPSAASTVAVSGAATQKDAIGRPLKAGALKRLIRGRNAAGADDAASKGASADEEALLGAQSAQWHRRWTPTADTPAESQRNQSLASIVLRALGYVPGPQLPLEFGGPHEDFTVLGAASALVARLLPAEADAAGPAPLSLRDQRILARKAARNSAKTGSRTTTPSVDWHASPVAGLLPQSNARPKTPKARIKKRLKKQRERPAGDNSTTAANGDVQQQQPRKPSQKKGSLFEVKLPTTLQNLTAHQRAHRRRPKSAGKVRTKTTRVASSSSASDDAHRQRRSKKHTRERSTRGGSDSSGEERRATKPKRQRAMAADGQEDDSSRSKRRKATKPTITKAPRAKKRRRKGAPQQQAAKEDEDEPDSEKKEAASKSTPKKKKKKKRKKSN